MRSAASTPYSSPGSMTFCATSRLSRPFTNSYGFAGSGICFTSTTTFMAPYVYPKTGRRANRPEKTSNDLRPRLPRHRLDRLVEVSDHHADAGPTRCDRGFDLRSHGTGMKETVGQRERGMVGGELPIGSPIDLDRFDVGENEQQVRAERSRQERGRSILVDHSWNAARAAVLLHDGNAAASGDDRN